MIWKFVFFYIKFRCLLFSAYQLFKQAADLGHIGAKEELAFGHLIGVHLPMNFNQAKLYFDQGVQTGSAQSHFVCSDLIYCIA